ncbi:hypothetical protein ALO46_102310 [Pseudomonas syringae pv. solidagae]|uniref:Uncharacterized protein n=3 Tax=Pseudomonas syringae group TaxID=136849 RepID=A0A3M5WYT6_9PSED|nr:Unknown protein sequence [Pseudomonas syringae pv. aceris]KPY60933.1 hypothetical protein ALO46_102310 [Pseudomonas syringae pv. solidagae]RMU74825.1 hypothetical protein ALP23_102013 [Pseudomonas syringae pv. apii]KPW26315.1 hypothetical protein ALO91_102684 [Pseudomonas syringae pv. aceris]RMT34868.1 hypothetical protein ALP49_102331 [Pseudomonas syringae pv. solidagae]
MESGIQVSILWLVTRLPNDVLQQPIMIKYLEPFLEALA